MAHIFQEGDEFKINPKWFPKCNAKNKTYLVNHISKFGNLVYYKDNRTNIKCTCHQCRQGMPNRWGGYDPEKKEFKSIPISEIILVKPRLQRNRDIVLKQLLGKD